VGSGWRSQTIQRLTRFGNIDLERGREENTILEKFSLKGKAAIVTGSARGLGKGIALGLAEAGCKTLLADVFRPTETEREIIAIGGSARSIVCNLQEDTSIEKITNGALDAYGRIDVLVNNAGITRRYPAIEMPAESWDEVISVNLRACFLLSQAAAREMVKRNIRGKIINIASMQSFQGGVLLAAYTAAKSGLAGLTRALAVEWAPLGINVNAIAPGYMVTEMTEPIMRDPTRNRQILDRIPAGKWGTSDDLKGAVVFLASEASSYVHGTILCVDGGWLAR
jgi:2-deoxy-D-gluconate 3-dehydrogenase